LRVLRSHPQQRDCFLDEEQSVLGILVGNI
jgi:hypothetical protein